MAAHIHAETFDQVGDFEAYRAACRWLTDRGIAYGSMQAGSPTGLMVGNYAISKWRNLSAQDRAELHGTMTGDMRKGPVRVALSAEATAMIGEQP